MNGVVKFLLRNEVKLTNKDPVIGDSHGGFEKVEHVDSTVLFERSIMFWLDCPNFD